MHLASRCAAAVALLLAGCAGGPTVHLADIGASGERLELQDAAFFPDENRYGAAAALATLLYTDGVPVGPDKVEPRLARALSASDLNAALARVAIAFGRFAFPLDGRAESLIAEVRAGHPALVLMNLGGSGDKSQWRYAVLIGYEPATDSLLFRSGREGRVRMTPTDFLPRWRDGGNLAFVLSDGRRMPATATLDRWIAASEAATREGRPDLAEAAANAARDKWPNELLPWIALGNARYGALNYAGAEQAYVKALAIKENNPVIHNNLALVLLERHCVSLAEAEVAKALATETDPALRAAYAQTEDKIRRYAGTAVYCVAPGADGQAPIEYDVLPLNPDTPRAPRAPRSRPRK
jgi:tetratricopeptide (TPR) repeat protein